MSDNGVPILGICKKHEEPHKQVFACESWEAVGTCDSMALTEHRKLTSCVNWRPIEKPAQPPSEPLPCGHFPNVEGKCDCEKPAAEPLCAACHHLRNDPRFHFEAPGRNWGAALHHFVREPDALAPALKQGEPDQK